MIKKIIKYFNILVSQSSILVGGQAVIEGVLMRVPGAYSTAVRKANGEIIVDRYKFESILEKYNLKNTIIIRGMIGLFESMKIGFKTLQWSADIAEETEEKNSPIVEFSLTILSILFVITLFFAGPLGITSIVFNDQLNPILFNLSAGLIRIFFFLIYLIAISQMNDVYRLFQYHELI